jgi:hypothetical protein
METMESTRSYVHKELSEPVTAIGGHYTFEKEVRLPYKDREIFYLVGYAVLDATCCGTGGCAYAHVQGFIVDWKNRQDNSGYPISIVMPIREPHLQQQISQLIEKKEMVQQIIFT